MAVIDVPGFVADLKEHAVDHGFHVHDERHFVETYSLRQPWEVDLHPEEACNGPIDLHLALRVDPRVLLAFEDAVHKLPEPDDEPPDEFDFPLMFAWRLPPLPDPPDLLVLATELAGVGGMDLPIEVSAIDSFATVTDAPERSLSIGGSVDGVAGQGDRRRGDPVRDARPLPGRQPVPARPGAGLARRGVSRMIRASLWYDDQEQGVANERARTHRDPEGPPADTEIEMGIIAPVDRRGPDRRRPLPDRGRAAVGGRPP